MELFGATDVGRVRRNNEDGFTIAPDLGLAVVADGMGGAACGEVASAITLETLLKFVREPAETLTPEELLKEAVRSCNQRVREASIDQTGCMGMGSTVVAACWREGHIWIANVGDSRAYRWRDGALTQVSFDQNVANELRFNLNFTEEQINRHPHRNALTMAIGSSNEILVRVWEDNLESNDLFLLCSDGLYGPLGQESIAQHLREAGPLPQAVEKMISLANERGGPDNITVILMRWAENPLDPE
ncbi:MAG: serine/threonine-protein phosphatase [Acidobacteriia bacterium]|nr:serine/threonine-protein phosphatase [Terriglobia bacterium]